MRLRAEVGEAADLRFADGQLADTGVFGEGGDGHQVGGLDRPVVTDLGFGTDVVAVLIAVGRVAFGDPVDVGQHVTACHTSKAPLRSAGVRGSVTVCVRGRRGPRRTGRSQGQWD